MKLKDVDGGEKLPHKVMWMLNFYLENIFFLMISSRE